jgi:CHAD domain-containing protein
MQSVTMKRAKWVKPSHAREPVSPVAAGALRERYDMVWEYASLSAAKWEDDAEFVHQLRVATRRAAAAMETFAELLPPHKSRRMLKRLNRLRQATGEARDADVLMDRFSRQQSEGRDELATVLDQLRKLRCEAQKAIVVAVDRLAEKGFVRKAEALCERIRWRDEGPEPTYADQAPSLLAREVKKFFAAAAHDLSDSHALHELRIQGKALRYTMEVLSGAFDRRFRHEIYPQFREFQDRLGAINDHAAAHKRLAEWAEGLAQPLAGEFAHLAEVESQRSSELRQEFLAWWSDERRLELQQQLGSTARIETDVQP